MFKNRRSKRPRFRKRCRSSKRCRRSTHNAIQRPVAEPNLSRQRAVEAVAGGGEAVEEGGEERRGGDEAVVEEDDGAGMEAAHDAVSHAGFPVWAVAMHCVKAPYAPADSLESEAFHGAGNRWIYNAERWTEKTYLGAGQCFQSCLATPDILGHARRRVKRKQILMAPRVDSYLMSICKRLTDNIFVSGNFFAYDKEGCAGSMFTQNVQDPGGASRIAQNIGISFTPDRAVVKGQIDYFPGCTFTTKSLQIHARPDTCGCPEKETADRQDNADDNERRHRELQCNIIGNQCHDAVRIDIVHVHGHRTGTISGEAVGDDDGKH